MSPTKDYFYWHYKITNFLLFNSPKHWFLQVIYWPICLFHLFLINASAFLEFTKLCLGGSGDFSTNVLNLGVAVLHFMGVNRVARWIFIKKDYEVLIKRIRKINLDFTIFTQTGSMENNNKATIRPKSNPIEEYQTTKMEQSKYFCLKVYLFFFCYVFFNLSVSYSLNYLQMPTYEKWNPTLNKNSTYRDYPYPLWYPFDTSLSDGYYWLGFFYQPYAFAFLMMGFFSVDCLTINIIVYLTSHVNVLGYALTYVDENIEPSLTVQEVMALKRERLKMCVKELQEVYRCARVLNNIFSSQILTQMLCMSTAMCCTVYRITTVTVHAETGYLSSMVIVLALQVFTESWVCQEFTLELLEMPNRIYEMDWITYPPKLRRILLFIMERLQTPFYFTMAYWQPIDVGVFLATLKFSYSFYTLITQSES